MNIFNHKWNARCAPLGGGDAKGTRVLMSAHWRGCAVARGRASCLPASHTCGTGGAAAAGPQARAHAAAPVGPVQECAFVRACRRGASRFAVPRPPLYGARLAALAKLCRALRSRPAGDDRLAVAGPALRPGGGCCAAASFGWPLPLERARAALPARPAAGGGNPCAALRGAPLHCALRCRRPLSRASLVARCRPSPALPGEAM